MSEIGKDYDYPDDLIDENTLNKVLPSSTQTTLDLTQKRYLYWLPKMDLNKQKAYQKSHPNSQPITALKNAARFDRKIRVKDGIAYQKVVDTYNKNMLTPEEQTFKQAVLDNPMASNRQIAKIARPDISGTALNAVYNRLNKSLSVKDPDWRAKLAANYDIDGAFERLADMSRGKAKTVIEVADADTGAMVETERYVPVSPETQRKTIMDMLAFTGMRPEETALDVSRKEAREKHGNVINQILNINILGIDT